MKKAMFFQSVAVACSLLFSIHASAAGESLRSEDGAARSYGATTMQKRTFAMQMPHMKRSKPAGLRAPLAFQLYCLKNIDACRAGKDTKIASSRASMSKIRSVNVAVNRSIRPRNDRGADAWNDKARSGDCEDFALAKRRKLIEQGFPVGALRIAVARTNRGEGHAVLVVRTSSGEMVLDNRTDTIKPWSRTTLTKVKMSGANPLHWR